MISSPITFNPRTFIRNCSVISIIVFPLLFTAYYFDFFNLRKWASDITMPLRHNIVRERDIMVPMRDSVRLATDLHFPNDMPPPYPSILIRTTYGAYGFAWVKKFVHHGYAVIVQDVRGRYQSEGDYLGPHQHSKMDGYDTVDWISKQPWSNGKLGTFGCSYLGEVQYLLAAAQHPAHITLIAEGGGGAIGKAQNSYDYFGVFENGVLNLVGALGWFTAESAVHIKVPELPETYAENMREHIDKLPVSALSETMVPYENGFNDIISHSMQDPWWEEAGYLDKNQSFSASGLHINAWFDQTLKDSFRIADYMREAGVNERSQYQRMILGPGLHCSGHKMTNNTQSSETVTVGDLSFPYTDIDYWQTYFDWFDYWLKGNKGKPLPKNYNYHLLNADRWETSDSWPPSSTQNYRLYLTPDFQLDQMPTEQETNLWHQYDYDPLDPTPTLGGNICCTYRDDELAGPVDQSPLTSRKDVLTYQGPLLEKSLDLIGNANIYLQVSTNVPDTDFIAKLIDIAPNGKMYILHDGVVRMRYRKGVQFAPELVQPGNKYDVQIELRPIAYRFKPGHRIGLMISSSNFPRLARNLNSGEHEYNSAKTAIARNRIHISPNAPSYLELPVRFESLAN